MSSYVQRTWALRKKEAEGVFKKNLFIKGLISAGPKTFNVHSLFLVITLL